MKYKLVIFDLDGTLLDTSPGIFNSVRYAESKMGFDPVENALLERFIGPPPKEMYKEIYKVNEEDALKAAKFHREYGREKAIYEASLYPEIKEILMELKSNGIKLAVATLKSQPIAEKILEYFDILQYFDSVIGMDKDESMTKSQIILKVMNDLGIKEGCVMVGDSQYDLDGANEAGIDFIGALYGFGLKGEDKYNFMTIGKPGELSRLVVER